LDVGQRNEVALQKSPGGVEPPGSSGGNAQRGHRTATRLTLYLHTIDGRLGASPNFKPTEANLPDAEAIANVRTTTMANGTDRKHRLHE
jgi:hypothetical protein